MNFIGYYPKAISRKLCETILDDIHSGRVESKDSKFQNDFSNYDYTTYPINQSFEYHDLMLERAEVALHDYFEDNQLAKLINISNFDYSHSNVDKLDDGVGLPLHFDKEYDEKSFISKRNFVIITYLNDIEVGGELCFPLQKKVIKPSAGDMVILPTFFTHPHYVTPPMFSDRYAYHINYTTKKNELHKESTQPIR